MPEVQTLNAWSAEQAQGTSRVYHLRDEGLHAVQAYLERVWGDAARRFRLLAENLGESSDQGIER